MAAQGLTARRCRDRPGTTTPPETARPQTCTRFRDTPACLSNRRELQALRRDPRRRRQAPGIEPALLPRARRASGTAVTPRVRRPRGRASRCWLADVRPAARRATVAIGEHHAVA